MAVDNSITFGGVNSADFGIYISGEGVFNAPKRDVEMIEIPGRNGAFALDNGRFENIEVTYPAFNYEPDNYDTFMQNLSDFRNAICAQRGYQRLTDTFHPDEYRMATYIGGLEIKPVKYNTASEFNIVFNCKPQRWLTSGETEITVTSGDELTNPTLFESSPLLEVGGLGTIEFNGFDIEFEGTLYGEIVIANKSMHDLSNTVTVTLDTTKLNIGDPIYPVVKECQIIRTLRGKNIFAIIGVDTLVNALEAEITQYKQNGKYFLNMSLFPDFGEGFEYGTSKTIISSATYRFKYGITTYSKPIQATITYDGADTYTVSINSGGSLPSGVIESTPYMYSPTMHADSSKYITDSIFVDCDLGETYIIDNGNYMSLNQYFDLGSNLPKLASGTNIITYDNTITLCKITPRWWKV